MEKVHSFRIRKGKPVKGLSWLRRGVVAVAAFAVAASVACAPTSSGAGYDDDDEPVAAGSPDAGNVGDTNCFQQMTPEQRQELQGEVTQTTGTTTNGTETVCVLEADGSGNYVEHYYAEEDHFNDFLLYALLFRHSNSLMTYGLVTGDLTFGEYLALSALTSVGSDGRAYHPYSRHSDGSWARQKTVINNYNVTNVRYGSKPAVSLKTAYGQKPPPGYGKSTLPPVSKPQRNVGVPNTTPNKAPGSTKVTPPSTPKQSTPTAGKPKANTPKPPAATPKPPPAPKPAPKPPKTK